MYRGIKPLGIIPVLLLYFKVFKSRIFELNVCHQRKVLSLSEKINFAKLTVLLYDNYNNQN